MCPTCPLWGLGLIAALHLLAVLANLVSLSVLVYKLLSLPVSTLPVSTIHHMAIMRIHAITHTACSTGPATMCAQRMAVVTVSYQSWQGPLKPSLEKLERPKKLLRSWPHQEVSTLITVKWAGMGLGEQGSTKMLTG